MLRCRLRRPCWVGKTVLSIVAIYLLVTLLVAPLALKFWLPAHLSKQGSAQWQIGSAWLNPLSFAVSINRFQLLSADSQTLAKFDSLRVNLDPVASLLRRQFRIRSVALSGSEWFPTMQQDGHINLLLVLDSFIDPDPVEDREPTDLPNFWIGSLLIDNLAIHYRDERFSEPFTKSISAAGFSIVNVHSGTDKASPFDFFADSADAESVRISGHLQMNPLQLLGSIQGSAIRIKDYAILAGDNLPLLLKRGMLDFDLNYTLGLEPLGLAISDFNLQIEGLEGMADGVGELAIARIQSINGSGSLEPLAFQLDKLVIEDWHLLHQRTGGQSSPSTLASTADGANDIDAEIAPQQPALTAIDLTINEILLKRGEVTLIDTTVHPVVNAVAAPVEITLRDVSNAPNHATSFIANAAVANRGRLAIEGHLTLADPQTDSALQAELRDLDLAPFSGYPNQMIGRSIRNGFLNADISASVTDAQLIANSRIALHQLQLGELNPGFTGTVLPVGLALRALTDTDGVVRLSIPVSGNLNDPNFNPAAVVVRVLTGTLLNALTAPTDVATSGTSGMLGTVTGALRGIFSRPTETQPVESEASSAPDTNPPQ